MSQIDSKKKKEFTDNKKKLFPEQLRSLIDEYGKARGKKLTHAELAKQIPVARETISYWLSGKSYPGTEVIKRLTEIFALPPRYFEYYDDGMTLIDERTHNNLQREAEETAQHIGLSPALFAFIKENPALADAVVSASWVDAYLQSLDKNVPELPDHTYQVKASSGVKIYPPAEVLYMLRIVQRDLTDYALFLIQKWSKIIHDKHKESLTIGEVSETARGSFDSSGNEYMSPLECYSLELRGRSSLTPGSSLLVDMYKNMSHEGQKAMIDKAYDVFHEYRKTDKKAQLIRKAVRKSIQTGTPVPPLAEILKDET